MSDPSEVKGDTPVVETGSVVDAQGGTNATPVNVNPVALKKEHHVELDNRNNTEIHLSHKMYIPKDVLNGDSNLNVHFQEDTLRAAGGPASLNILNPNKIDVKVKSPASFGIDFGVGPTPKENESRVKVGGSVNNTVYTATNPNTHFDLDGKSHTHHVIVHGDKHNPTTKTVKIANTNTPEKTHKNLASLSQLYYNLQPENIDRDMQSVTSKAGITKHVVPVDSPMGKLAARNGQVLNKKNGQVAKPFDVLHYTRKGTNNKDKEPHLVLDEEHKNLFVDDMTELTQKNGLNMTINGTGTQYTTGAEALVDFTIHRDPYSYDKKIGKVVVHKETNPNDVTLTPRLASKHLGGTHLKEAEEAEREENTAIKKVVAAENEPTLVDMVFQD